MAIFRLIDINGDPVAPFDHYIKALCDREYAPATVKRYSQVVANFLDYLIEAGVYGQPISERELNSAVNRYLRVRLHADRIREASDQEDEFIQWAKPIVANLHMRSVQATENTVAAINLFLRLSDLLARSEWERVKQYGLQNNGGDNRSVIAAISGFQSLPYPQRKALMQASMLANVMRMNPAGIAKPRGLSSGRRRSRFSDEEYLDFPILRFADLVAAATTDRDGALWLLLGGTGIRMSEASTLRWSQVDIANQRIYIDDPNKLRFADHLPLEAKLRFKGRSVSETYFIPAIRGRFFDALRDFLKHEYVPGCNHDFVFQDIHSVSQRGRPLHELSDTARIGAFKRAVLRAGVPHPKKGKDYTPHSLRHMYGVYMLNYLPVPGGYGLAIKEVQKLMGHQTDIATRHYARQDRAILSSKLEYADQFVSVLTDEWKSLPEMIANRLRDEADRIEGRCKQ